MSREKRYPALRRGRLFSSVFLALVFAVTYLFLPALPEVAQFADLLSQICKVAAFSSVSLGLAQAFADTSLFKAEEEGERRMPAMKPEVQIETSIKIAELGDFGAPGVRIEEVICIGSSDNSEQDANVRVKEIVETSIER